MRKPFVQTFFILVLLGSFASSLHAEPIRVVTGGQVVARPNGGSFTLIGEDFFLTGGVPDGFASTLFLCSPCEPADRIALGLSSSAGGHFQDGQPGEFAGTAYAATYLWGHFTFTSSDIYSQALGLGGDRLIAPFTFSGELFNYASPQQGESGGPAVFFAQLIGSGTATAHFVRGPGALAFAQNITYDFASPAAATPEPGTLILCGSAVAWALARRRRLQ